MSNEQDTNHTDLSRRRLLGAGFALSGLALAGCATAPDSGPSIGRVVIVGGGFGGATAARYLKMWGGNVDVTMVERNANFVSCPISNLVLGGHKQMADITRGYDGLRALGVKVVQGEVTVVDAAAKKVRLAGGGELAYDRLIVSPGIDFMTDAVGGLASALATDQVTHSWKAGPQTVLLRKQLEAMPDGGVFAIAIPKVPYRCPPGPYERACLIADWMRVKKPQAKLMVLDANMDFVTEKDNFSRAFLDLHGKVIDYRTSVVIDSVDPASRTINTNQGVVRGDVINLIPRQRAPQLLADAGLLNATGGRFAAVDVLSYASTAAPRTHVIGDASATTQPKAGHIANQEAKVCADALARIFAGGSPDPAPVTNSACFSTITMTQASWLHALFQYDPASASMKAVTAATMASEGWNGDHFEDMGTWFRALMADTFA